MEEVSHAASRAAQRRRDGGWPSVLADSAPAQRVSGHFGSLSQAASAGSEKRALSRAGPPAHDRDEAPPAGRSRKRRASCRPRRPDRSPLSVSTDRQHLTVYDGDRAVAEMVIRPACWAIRRRTAFSASIETGVPSLEHLFLRADAPYGASICPGLPCMRPCDGPGLAAACGLPAAFARGVFQRAPSGAGAKNNPRDVKPSLCRGRAFRAAAVRGRFLVMGEQADRRPHERRDRRPDRRSARSKAAHAVSTPPAPRRSPRSVSRRTGMMQAAPSRRSNSPVTIDRSRTSRSARMSTWRKARRPAAWPGRPSASSARCARRTYRRRG